MTTNPLLIVGWPLHMAIFDLVSEAWRDYAQITRASEFHSSQEVFAAGRRHLWRELCGQLMMGELVAQGFLTKPITLADAVNKIKIEPQYFASAIADFDKNILTMSNGVVFTDVRIFLVSTGQRPSVLDPKAQNPAETLYSTGVAGRPTSINLCRSEMFARAARGDLAQNVTEEARALAKWLKENYSTAPTLTAKSIENNIRSQYRGLKPPK